MTPVFLHSRRANVLHISLKRYSAFPLNGVSSQRFPAACQQERFMERLPTNKSLTSSFGGLKLAVNIFQRVVNQTAPPFHLPNGRGEDEVGL